MTSSGFGFGEKSAIASAYAQMYAPKRIIESCCGKTKKNKFRKIRRNVKKNVKESVAINEGAGAGYRITIEGIVIGNEVTNVKQIGKGRYGEREFSFNVNIVPGNYDVTADSYYQRLFPGEYDDGNVEIDGGNLEGTFAYWGEEQPLTEEMVTQEIANELNGKTTTISTVYGGGWVHQFLPEDGRISLDRISSDISDSEETFNIDFEKATIISINMAKEINSGYDDGSNDDEDSNDDVDELQESCCNGKCSNRGKLPTKHCIPKKTGSKLGVRKMLPFNKRDAKSSAKKFTPPVKKVVESAKVLTNGYCIVDGNKTLCTNDVNESYFNKDGISSETRIYESAISALKDIKKVNKLRKPNKKYCIRKCECVGESFQFVQSGTKVDESEKVNEAGLLGSFFDAGKNLVNGGIDTIKNFGNGVIDTGKGIVTLDPKATVNGLANTVTGTVGGALNTANQAGADITGLNVKDSLANYMKPTQQIQTSAPTASQNNKMEQEADDAMANSDAAMYGGDVSTTTPPTQQPTTVNNNNGAQNVTATTPTNTNGSSTINAQSDALKRRQEETQTNSAPAEYASTTVQNIAKDNGSNAYDMLKGTDDNNKLGNIVKDSAQKQIAAEKGQSVQQMQQQSKANAEVMKNATLQQKNEISRMLRSRNNPENTNMPTMNDVQSKINSFAQQQQQNTLPPLASGSTTTQPQTNAANNDAQREAEYQRELAALNKKYGK